MSKKKINESEEIPMLKEGPACIINNMDGLKSELKKNRPSEEKKRKIANSISNLDTDRLRRLCSHK